MQINMNNLTVKEQNTLVQLLLKTSFEFGKRPQRGDIYFFITSTLNIQESKWTNSKFDKEAYNARNCFKTKHEAEFYVERRKIIIELQQYVEERTIGVNWFDDSRKYYFCYSKVADKLIIKNLKYITDYTRVYFPSYDDCARALKQIGVDRIRKYLFNVPDADNNAEKCLSMRAAGV